MVQKSLGVSGSLRQRKTHRATLRDIKHGSWPKSYSKGRNRLHEDLFSYIKENSLQVMMALVAHFDLELHQMDVKMDFLNGMLEEELYMKQPKGLSSSSGEHLVCKLNKSIYDLKQASLQWYLKFHKVITSFGFEENVMDHCIYQKVGRSKTCFLISYVDDILLATNNKGLPCEVKQFL